MSEHLVITISREYGSGGRFIGRRVADALDIPFYDRNIIDMAAQKSGLAAEFITENEEKVASRLYDHTLLRGHGALLYPSLAPQSSYSNLDRIFFAQSAVIRELAAKGPCVIVGRCAGYVLREYRRCLRVFINGDKESRMARAVEFLGVPADRAAAEVAKRDKQRANYYRHYTDQQWGDADNYHLTIDSGFFNIDGAAAIIVEAAKQLG